MNVFDDMEDYINKVTMINLESKVVELNSLLDEIVQHDYKTAKQFSDKIKSNLKLFNEMKLEKQAEKYEAEAKADHFTSEQFDNV